MTQQPKEISYRAKTNKDMEESLTYLLSENVDPKRLLLYNSSSYPSWKRLGTRGRGRRQEGRKERSRRDTNDFESSETTTCVTVVVIHVMTHWRQSWDQTTERGSRNGDHALDMVTATDMDTTMTQQTDGA